MESFEVTVKEETFKITLNADNSFSVFNHATYHIIKKNDFGAWTEVAHRFGKDYIPLDAIGDAIDKHNTSWPSKAFGLMT